MAFEEFKKKVSSPDLSHRDLIYEGFVFTSLCNPSNVYDAVYIRDPADARAWGDGNAHSSRSLQEHIDFINEYKIEKAYVVAEDLSFLKNCPTLRHISVTPPLTATDGYDFSPLYELKGLKSVHCSTCYGKFHEHHSTVDYSKFPQLELVAPQCEYDLNFQKIPTLKSLIVRNYREDDITHLFCSKVLDTLSITTSKIRSLSGIAKAPKLQRLSLNYNRSLYDIREIAGVTKSLRALVIRNCPKIEDFSVLSELTNLEYLELDGSNLLPDLKFLDQLPNLKTLRMGMKITDGDLTPTLRLSNVWFKKTHAHYNLRKKDLPAGSAYYGEENIDLWRRWNDSNID